MRARTQAVILLIATQAGLGEVWAQDPAADATAAPGMTVEERLERIESTLDNQGLLELVQQLQILELEVSRLRGEAEVQNHALEQLRKRQRDLYADLDRRIQRIEPPANAAPGAAVGADEPPLQTLAPFQETDATGGRQAETPLTLELVGVEQGSAGTEGEAGVPLAPALAAAETPEDRDAGTGASEIPEVTGPGTGAPETPEVTGPGTGASETPEVTGPGARAPEMTEGVVPGVPVEVRPEQIEAEYQQAFGLLKQSLYDRSITAFREFLARHPDSDYAGNAQFWLAEAYYVNGHFGQALTEYDTLARQYPESRKLPQAQLKAALCRAELGQAEAARVQLQEIVQHYPGTTTASLAQNRLAEIAAETARAD